MSQVIRLVSAKYMMVDSADRQETEVWFRFSKDEGEGQLFVGGDQDPIKAMEKAFRQMIEAFKLLPQGLESRLFDYAQLGLVAHKDRGIKANGQKPFEHDPKQNVFVVSLYKKDPEEKQSPQLVVNTKENGCANRAAIRAICEVYAKVHGIQIELFWTNQVQNLGQLTPA